MSLLNNNSFVPYKNIKIKLSNELEPLDKLDIFDTNKHTEIQKELIVKNDKSKINREFIYLYDKYFLQKQNTVLDIIEELRFFDSRNGTNLFTNILYLNLYNLLYN